MWFEIPSKVYWKIFNRYDKELRVFGACTHLENSSRFDARVLTEWGFEQSQTPIIKSVRQPKSQAITTPLAEWPIKHYMYVDDGGDY